MNSIITDAALVLSRWVELSILGKATIILVLGLTAAWLAGRARASVRHLLLASTFAALLALPLIVLTAPGVTIAVPASPVSASIGASQPASRSETPFSALSRLERQTLDRGPWSAPSWATIVRSGWIAGALLLFVSIALALWRFRRTRRDGLPCPELRELTQSLASECGVRRPIEVLLHESIPAPLTCGVWHPAIVLPSDAREWSCADLRRALVHELEHVRRGDWVIQLVARAICAFYWFHPLVWVAWRRLCLEAERACDDVVVQSERTEYAEQLVLLARRVAKVNLAAILGMANRSDLSTRVSALLDDNQRRGRASLLATAIALGIASLVVLALAPVRAVAQSRTPTVATTQQSGSHTKSTRPSTPLDRALFEAAESGDISGIDKLLNAGANLNCTLDGDGSPLMGAARNGKLAAVRLLLDRGADRNLPVPGDGNPLIVAAHQGHADVVALLLDRGADPNFPVPGDGNPLIKAARQGHIDVVAMLLDRGANIDQIVPEDENALIQASGKGHLHIVKLLVIRGANVNARAWAEGAFERPNGEWRTPLSMARKSGHAEIVAFLLSAGARE